MFHRLKQSFEAFAAVLDEILESDPDAGLDAGFDAILDGDPAPTAFAHPHDRSVSISIPRRPGSVAPRELHCLCPVCPSPGRRPAKIPG